MLEFLIAQDAGKLGNNGRANIRRMQSVMQRLNLMTDDILAYLQVSGDAESIQEHSLKLCVEEVLGQMDQKIHHANASVAAEVYGVINADRSLFSLLLQHLLSVALRSATGTKPLSILILSDYVSVEDADFVVVSVRDNGPGFEADQLDKIFDLFNSEDHRLPSRGLGIGLAIARKIMDIHQGLIRVSSTRGEATTFSCYFPFQ
jgi:light-regulated signal transduction histidine kinase (bacteriophytochrome)